MITDYNDVRRKYRIIALLSVWRWLVIILIAFVAVIVVIFSPPRNPIDDQMTKGKEFVRQIDVVDDRKNGFMVRYFTKEMVTKERLCEIRDRTSVRDSLDKLQRMAPLVFGDMLTTDIYDFAEFAIRFDPADIKIHTIFVCGPDKEKLYVGKNPRIENWAKWIHPGTLQGLLFITDEDIYCHGKGLGKVYRYFECRSLNQISETDEHFSHFSEAERLY